MAAKQRFSADEKQRIKEGYRRLASMMVDADVAYLGESAVYRILSDRNLLCRWARQGRKLEQIPCRVTHAQSNGLIERWHRTTRDALEDGGVPGTHPKTPRAIEAWIDHYNEQCLHAGLGDIQPAEYFHGEPDRTQAEAGRGPAEPQARERDGPGGHRGPCRTDRGAD
jgi:transposase InsO family protein